MSHDTVVPAGTSPARPPGDLNPRTDPPLDFRERPLDEMTPADYDALGFLCGLEVHQQLQTKRKLFCRCPAGVRTTRVDAEVLRHMRPTLSELGEYDGTALMEFKTRKEIVYRLARGSVCTYEMDDTPPFPMDEEAVRYALEMARLYDLKLVSELHVMRKQYLDGSIPTGFQRTTMVGLGGAIPFRDSVLGRDQILRIRQLSLEEDSAREVSDVGHRVVFRTDRLGMPLTETVTEPDLLNPWDVQAGMRLIARVAHAGGRARRGLGAARQDVNVSIAGGRRVEIKGVPSHRILPKLVHNEAFRQLALLRVRAELQRRGARAEDLRLPPKGLPWEVSDLAVDARKMLQRCAFEPLSRALGRGEMVAAVRLPGFGGLLRWRTQPGMNFARELTGRVRVIACLTARPFSIHSDVVDFGLVGSTWNALRAALRAGSWREDGVVVLWGPEQDVATGVREVLLRAAEAFVGVPAETRMAYADGTTGFERILPGADRMYPDTDTPPLPVPDAWVDELETRMATEVELPWTREDRYEALGLPRPLAWRLADAPWAGLFDELLGAEQAGALQGDGAPPPGAVARRVAYALEQRFARPCRVADRAALPPAARLRPWVAALTRGGAALQAAGVMLDALLAAPDTPPDEVLAPWRAPAPTPDEAAAEAARRVGEAASEARAGAVRTRAPQARRRWIMGEAMRALVGRVPAAQVAAAVDRLTRDELVGQEVAS